MSKNLHELLNFRISRSKGVEAIVDGLHVCAVLACWLNALQPYLQLGLTLAVLALWWLSRKRRNDKDINLAFAKNHGWTISFDGLDFEEVVILETTVVTSTVIFLHYRTAARSTRGLLIAKDSMDGNEFRRLLVRLRLWGRCDQSDVFFR